jgi:hypothetical protein
MEQAMKRVGIVAIVAAASLTPAVVSACDGIAGRDVAIAFDGRQYTVSNTGREWVQIVFTAFGTTYNLQLAPGQSDTPRSPGMFTQPMSGYQACVATPLPVASGVSALRGGR